MLVCLKNVKRVFRFCYMNVYCMGTGGNICVNFSVSMLGVIMLKQCKESFRVIFFFFMNVYCMGTDGNIYVNFSVSMLGISA